MREPLGQKLLRPRIPFQISNLRFEIPEAVFHPWLDLVRRCGDLAAMTTPSQIRAKNDRGKPPSALVFRAWLPPHPGPEGEGESPAAAWRIQSASTRRSAGCGI